MGWRYSRTFIALLVAGNYRAAFSRALMSLHSSHTEAGITPQRMRREKMAHPRQKPTNASSEAAPANMPITTREAKSKSRIHNTDAVMEKTAPMP
jgi:hypothetical protein